MSKISVIIPVYNAERYIGKCVDKILNQPYKEFELILIDDGSTDRSGEICDQIAKRNDKVRVIHKKNGGVSSARNMGIEHSSGKYIMFVDADDLITETSLSTLASYQEKYDVDWICGSYYMKKSRGRIKDYKYKLKHIDRNSLENEFFYLFDQVGLQPWAKLFRRDIIEKYNIRYKCGIPYGEDTIFNINYYMYCKSTIIIPDFIYYYSYDNSISAAKKYYKDIYMYKQLLLESEMEYFEFHNCSSIFEYKVNELREKYFRECLEHYILRCKNKSDCKKLIRKSSEVILNNIHGECKYKSYIEHDDIDKLIVRWKKEHFTFYCKSKILDWLRAHRLC